MGNGIKLFSLGVMILAISFLGFVVENIWLAITKGYIDNRNMTLPFLLGYGLFVVAIYFMIGTPQEVEILGKWRIEKDGRWFYYFMVTVIVSAGEIALGTLVERICGFEYWNYEWIPFHLTKYTSLPTSLGFSAIICLVIENVFPVLIRMTEQYETIVTQVICAAVLGACTVDMVVSFCAMYKKRGPNVKWKIEKSTERGARRVEVHRYNSI